MPKFQTACGICRRGGSTAAERGFSLVELLGVLAIATILMTSAAPMFSWTTSSYRISGQINTLVGDLMYARSEAIKTGIPVTVCASADGATCLAGNNWQAGWIIFSDTNATQSVPVGQVPLRVQRSLPGGNTLVADNNVGAITFNRDGFALGLPANPVTLALRDPSSESGLTRCLAVSIVGKLNMQKAATGNCL
jgi:type IV fimbrial biogenesis protein FimT